MLHYQSKVELRLTLRERRRQFVSAIDAGQLALVFYRIPSPARKLIDNADIVGLYWPTRFEAPTESYGHQLSEVGKTLCLPYFETADAHMSFKQWLPGAALEKGPHGIDQPSSGAETLIPQAAFVPLVGFDADCNRIGQGKGHYDRWLVRNPLTKAIGLAWSAQEIESVPMESHDRPLDAVITESAIYLRRPDMPYPDTEETPLP